MRVSLVAGFGRWRGFGARRRVGSRWLALMVAAALAAGVVALDAGVGGAGSVDGEVASVRLSSGAPGELTISWDPPASTPSDYRVMWAEETQDYLSWKADNEATRGNSYPSGSATSLTLTGLTEGAQYKVRVRSRYRSGPNGPWSGPWTDEATQQVSSSAPAADPALGTRGDPQLFTSDAQIDPPLIISDGEDDENLQFAEQGSSPVVTLLSNYLIPGTDSQVRFDNTGDLVDQSFTTGGSSRNVRLLTSVTLSLSIAFEFTSDEIGVAVYTDAGGAPGRSLYAFPPRTVDSLGAVETTFEGEVPLEANTKYWLRMNSTTGQGSVLTVPGGAVDSDGLSDWSLGQNYYTVPAGQPRLAAVNGHALTVRLRGQVLEPSTVEPVGEDFGFDASTLGRLELGTVSSGTLSNSADRDLFKLENLPATSNSARDGQANRWTRKRYRVQAWFGDHAPGR